MVVREWYKAWFNSPYYHKLYFERDEAEARQFIERLLQYLQPKPGSRMIDIGCGRGRHSRILAASGYEVTGVDIAPDSITYAQQYEQENLQFYMHDMRLPFWINYFDYAFNFFTSFGYFPTQREHDDAVRTITASLKPNGILLFDYLNVHYAESHLVPEEIKTIDDTTYDIQRWQDAYHFYKKIIVTDTDLQKPAEYVEQVTKFSLGDFTEMLSYYKMQVVQVFGDYNLKPYDIYKTPRMIIVAKKTSP